MSEYWTSTAFAGLLLGLSVYVLKSIFQPSPVYPPGPRGLPLVGNALQVPQKHTWLKFSEWAKEYGDLVYLKVLGQPYIVINSAIVAKDLLDKRSAIYSDRPHFVFAGDLVGYDETFVLAPYGHNWKKQRRLVAQDFSPSTVPRYFGLQENEARRLVRNVIGNPGSFSSEIKLRIATVIIRVTYGYYLKGDDDPFFTMPLRAMENFSRASAPGNWLVDVLPVLKDMPAWMPGSGFLKTATQWRKVVWDASWNPYLWSKKGLETGEAFKPNLCGSVVAESDGQLSKDDELQLVWAASAVMGGGMDTNMSAVLTFFLMMTLHPEVQTKARAEIDAVIGQDRLPTISDRASLPYVRSVMTETFRWCPPIPLGIAHATSDIDIYKGYTIPKGSWVLPNVWHMLHDPESYPDPETFKPERYKGSDVEMRKVTDLVFGFGRRACPGFHFADGTIFAIISTVLSTCDVVPEIDDNGKALVPEVDYTSGTIVFPQPFKCRLVAHSSQALAMLSAEMERL
ncbi:putative monooxygenase [Heliocybe sulcata]|uniref:Putative monooxygenase n=1 Tax=Heliocybe sulcata TaxID=5364 RepID=A0A5C3MN94_9AGAM|nr:putative monooxygenase [Heliocybe sulcata]